MYITRFLLPLLFLFVGSRHFFSLSIFVQEHSAGYKLKFKNSSTVIPIFPQSRIYLFIYCVCIHTSRVFLCKSMNCGQTNEQKKYANVFVNSIYILRVCTSCIVCVWLYWSTRWMNWKEKSFYITFSAFSLYTYLATQATTST